MPRPPNIALLGAADPCGEAVLRLIEERDCGVGEVYLLDAAESDCSVTVRGTEIPVQTAAGFDWAQVDVLLSASRAAAAHRIEAAAMAAGCGVIGLGGTESGRRIRVPGAMSRAVRRVLAPVASAAGLARVDVFAALPVSLAGQAGIDELAGQTRSLFAMEGPEPEVFPLQMAFNLIAQAGPILADGASTYEAEAQLELRQSLRLPDLPVTVTASWAPLFYGGAMAVHGRAGAGLDTTRLRQWLAACDGVTLMDTDMPGGVPSPATDAQDSENVFVGRVRVMPDQPSRFALWLVIDMARLEAAGIVRALEISIEK